ncbi:MAG: MFS transporter [Pseudomonadota bacterium]
MTTGRAILFLAIGQTITWAGVFYLFAALLPRWEVAEGWSRTGLSACFAAAIAVSALASPAAGRLIDRGHGPALLTGSTLLGALTIGLLPLAPLSGSGLAGFAVLWLVAGLAMAGALYEPCFALITRCLRDGARRAITTVTLVAGFAGTLSFPAGHFIAEAAGWQAATTAAALAVALVAAPLTWLGTRHIETVCKAEKDAAEASERPTSPASAPPSAPSTGKPGFLSGWQRRFAAGRWGDPVFALLAVGLATIALCHGAVIAHILPLLSERGVSEASAVFAASCIGPMQVAGRVAMRLAEAYVTPHWVTCAGFIAMLVAAISLLAASLNAAAAVIFLGAFVLLQGSGYGVMSVMRPVRTRELLGERNFGAISGALALPYLLAAAAAPFAGALLWSVGGYDLMLAAVALCLAAGLALYLRASGTDRTKAT